MQPTKGEKIFRITYLIKGYYPEHTKKLQFNNKNRIQKWADNLNWHFSRESEVEKHAKRCSTARITMETRGGARRDSTAHASGRRGHHPARDRQAAGAGRGAGTRPVPRGRCPRALSCSPLSSPRGWPVRHRSPRCEDQTSGRSAPRAGRPRTACHARAAADRPQLSACQACGRPVTWPGRDGRRGEGGPQRKHRDGGHGPPPRPQVCVPGAAAPRGAAV